MTYDPMADEWWLYSLPSAYSGSYLISDSNFGMAYYSFTSKSWIALR